MNEKPEIVPVTTPAASEQKTLREALLILSISPVKKEQEAIARLERVAGRSVSEIIAELDSAQVLIDSIPQASSSTRKIHKAILTGIFAGTVMGLIAMFVQPGQVYTALLLGIGMGGSGAMLLNSMSEKTHPSNFKI